MISIGELDFKIPEAVQKGWGRRTFSLNFVMPDSDPASPAYIRDGRSRIKCGMTPFLDSLIEGWFKQFIFIFHTFCKVKFRSNHPRPLLEKEGCVPNPTNIFSYLNKTPA